MSRARARWLPWVVGLVAVSLGLAAALHRFGTSAADAAAVGLFERTFDDADGRPQPMKQWEGRLLVVNFWATWCAPCVEEMPELQRIHGEFADRGVAVVGLGIDSPSAIRRFRDEHRLNLPLLVAGAGGSELVRELGNPSGALPYTVLIGRDGLIAQARLGRIREAELRSWLESRVGKAPG
jgi:peroxiredoxin